MAEIRSLRPVLLFPMIALVLFVSGCGQQATTGINVDYQPPFAPVIFTIGSRGISVQTKGSIVTEWGTFSLGADINDNLQPKDNALYIIIRTKHNGVLKDVVYKIETNQQTVTITTNGTTTIELSTNRVFIDASKGNIKSIEVKGANSATTTPNAQVTQTPVPPPPTPTPQPSLSVDNAEKLIINYYDEQGEFAGTYLIKQITSMSIPNSDPTQVLCVEYDVSPIYSPETLFQTDTRTFNMQLSGKDWTVVGMGGTSSCTVSNGKTPPPQTESAAPPYYNNAVNLVEGWYDNVWNNGAYHMQSVNSLEFRQQVGDHVGACVHYEYTNNAISGDTPHPYYAEFGFAFINGHWEVNSLNQYGLAC